MFGPGVVDDYKSDCDGSEPVNVRAIVDRPMSVSFLFIISEITRLAGLCSC